MGGPRDRRVVLAGGGDRPTGAGAVGAGGLALTFGGHTEGRVEQERAVEGLWRIKEVDEQEEKGTGRWVIPDFGPRRGVVYRYTT